MAGTTLHVLPGTPSSPGQELILRGIDADARTMKPTVRPLLIGSLALGVFALVIGDWAIVFAMVCTSAAMAIVARRHKL